MFFKGIGMSRTTCILEKSLDFSSLRHKLIANNIANVNTPGFKRKDISFQTTLRKALKSSDYTLVGKRTDPRHFFIGPQPLEYLRPEITTDRHLINRNDENNVDIDHEVAELTKNALYYQIMTRRIAAEYSKLDMVIKKGGAA